MLYWISFGLLIAFWVFVGFVNFFYFNVNKESNSKYVKAIKIQGTIFTLVHILALSLYPKATQPELILSCLILSIGILLFGLTYATCMRVGRLDFALQDARPNFFISKGPYKIVRHPFYLSYILGWLGSTLSHGQYWLILTLFFMLPFYWVAARREEKSFQSTPFSEQYRHYKQKTWMFFPGL